MCKLGFALRFGSWRVHRRNSAFTTSPSSLISFACRVKLEKNRRAGEKCALKFTKRRSKVNSEYKKILKNELEALTRANRSHILNQIEYSDIYSVITEDKKKVEVNYLGLEYAEN